MPRQCFVKNIICAIEVKDVGDEGIIFSGTNVKVKRNNGKIEEVTDQNYQQANNLKHLFNRKY